MSTVRVIKNGEPADDEVIMFGDGSVSRGWRRAQFKSQMVLVQFSAESADREEAEYICRNLLQTVAYLERKHGLKK